MRRSAQAMKRDRNTAREATAAAGEQQVLERLAYRDAALAQREAEVAAEEAKNVAERDRLSVLQAEYEERLSTVVEGDCDCVVRQEAVPLPVHEENAPRDVGCHRLAGGRTHANYVTERIAGKDEKFRAVEWV